MREILEEAAMYKEGTNLAYTLNDLLSVTVPSAKLKEAQDFVKKCMGWNHIPASRPVG